MSTSYTDQLRHIAKQLTKEGWDLRASIIQHAADRMDAMEKLIIDYYYTHHKEEQSKLPEKPF